MIGLMNKYFDKRILNHAILLLDQLIPLVELQWRRSVQLRITIELQPYGHNSKWER